MKHPLVLREKIYVPVTRSFDLEELEDDFTVNIFDEKGCEPCDFRDARPCHECKECPNWQSTTRLYKEKHVKGVRYVGVPYGLKKLIPEYFPYAEDLDVVDKRALPPFSTGLRFTGQLRPHQVEVKEKLLRRIEKTGYLSGLIKAPPRSGKTVLMIELACHLKVRTLILANQYDFLRQFYDTFCGNDAVDPPTPALTNAPAIEKKTGVAPVRIAKCLDDFFEGDIVLATYQTFISEIGKERLAAVINSFGLVGIDEVHRSAAIHFLKTVSAFNSTHKVGLTATPKRKDCRHVLVNHVMGPVLAEAKVETLKPRVEFIPTGCAPKKDYTNWVYFFKWQTNQETRMDLIVEHAVKDIKAGHSIVIPCVHKETVFLLVKMINCQFPRPVAAEYVGNNAKRRDEVRNLATNGDIKVVVGIRSLVSTGINIPRWSMQYCICPTTNGPQFEQEFFRVLTPMEGKKQPVIKFFVDGASQWKAALRICLFHKENGLVHHKAIIPTEQWAIANTFLSGGKGRRDTRGKLTL